MSEEFSSLTGKTLRRVEQTDVDRIEFETIEGDQFALYHCQDCCEDVQVELVAGDLADLVGMPILLAEEATSNDNPPGYQAEWQPESQTWTFYKLRTIKGSVDIRWLGTSNGYYSESVSFGRIGS